MSNVGEVVVRPYTQKELAVACAAQLPGPLLFPGQVIRCTNANASEFTYMQAYRIERLYSPARAGVQLAGVRNDAGEMRTIPSTAWNLGQWEVVK